jgi:hypothetical protein
VGTLHVEVMVHAVTSRGPHNMKNIVDSIKSEVKLKI